MDDKGKPAVCGGGRGDNGMGGPVIYSNHSTTSDARQSPDFVAAALAYRRASRRQALAGLLSAAIWCTAQAVRLQALAEEAQR